MLQEKFSLDLSSFRKAINDIVKESKDAGKSVSDEFSKNIKIKIDSGEIEGLSELAKAEGLDIKKALESGYAGAFHSLGSDLTNQINQQKAALKQLAISGKEGSEEFKEIKEQLIKATKEAKELADVSDRIDKEISQAAESSKELGGGSGISGFFSEISGGLPDLQSLGSGLPLISGGLGALVSPAELAVGAISALTAGFTALVSEISILNEIQEKASQLTGLQGDELNKYSARVKTLAETFGDDFQEVNLAVQTAASNFGISYDEAFTIIEKGYLSGANAGDDFLAVIKEYAPQFEEAGKSLEDLTALQIQSRRLGVFDDKAIDLIKEAGLRFREFTQAQEDALSNAFGSKFAADIKEGIGSGALSLDDAISQVVDGLDTLDAQSRQTVIADVFGGPGEDAIGLLVKMNEINLSFDDLTTSSSQFQTAQEKQYAASLRLNEALAEFSDGTETSFSGIKALLTDIVAGLVENLTPAVQSIIKGFKLFGDTFGEIFGALFEVISTLVDAIFDILNPFTQLNEVLDDNETTLEKVKKGFRAVADFIRKFAAGIRAAKEAVVNFKKDVLAFIGLVDKESKTAPLKKLLEPPDAKDSIKAFEQLQARINSFAKDNEQGLFEKEEEFSALESSILNAIKKNEKELKLTEIQALSLQTALSSIEFKEKDDKKTPRIVDELAEAEKKFKELVKAGITKGQDYDNLVEKLARLRSEQSKYNKELAKQNELIRQLQLESLGIKDIQTDASVNFDVTEIQKNLKNSLDTINPEEISIKPRVAFDGFDLRGDFEKSITKDLTTFAIAFSEGLSITSELNIDNSDAIADLEQNKEALIEQFKAGIITREQYNKRSEELIREINELEREEKRKTLNIQEALNQSFIAGLQGVGQTAQDSINKSIEKLSELNKKAVETNDSTVNSFQNTKDIYKQVASDTLTILATTTAQTLANGDNVAKALIGTALNTLDALIPIFTAQIFGITAADPANVGTLGIWGVLKFAALTAALKGLVSVAKNAAGFEDGGYTGNYGTKQIAGVVHGKEWVLNAKSTSELRKKAPGLLENINENGFKGLLSSIKGASELKESNLKAILVRNDDEGIKNELRALRAEISRKTSFEHRFGEAKIKGNDLNILVNKTQKSRLRHIA